MSKFIVLLNFLGIVAIIIFIAFCIGEICEFMYEYNPKAYNSDKNQGREVIHMTWKEFREFSKYFPDKYVYTNNPHKRFRDDGDYQFLYYIDNKNDYYPIQFDKFFEYLSYKRYIHKLETNKETAKDKAERAEQNGYKAHMLEELRLSVLKELEQAETEIRSVDRPKIYSVNEIQDMLDEKEDNFTVGF